MDEQLAGLQTLTAARRSKLEESIQLHQYIRDVDEVMSWVKEKQSVASAEEYGKDFDHLLVGFDSLHESYLQALGRLQCIKHAFICTVFIHTHFMTDVVTNNCLM